MVTLLILLVLFIGAYSGYKKGILIQLLQTIGYAVVFIFALDYYQVVSDYLYLIVPYPSPFAPETNPYFFYDQSIMFTMDESYYDIISFIAIFIVGWLIVRFLIALLSYTLEKFRLPEPISGIGGSILGFIVNYLGLFYLLFLLSTIPYGFIQNRLADSFIGEKIITSTPVVSNRVYERFIGTVNEEAEENEPAMDIQGPPEETEEENTE